MKRVFLSLLIALGCAPIFSQTALQSDLQLANEYTYLRRGWQGSVGSGVGLFEESMALTVDGELGKHITPKFYVGGGVAANYNEVMSLGVYIAPRYYYSKGLNSFYVESSLGLTLFGVGKFNVYEYERSNTTKEYRYYKYKGLSPTSGIAIGYILNDRFSLEFGINAFMATLYEGYEYEDGTTDGRWNNGTSYYFDNCLLKVNYTFDLGSNLSEVKEKLRK